MTGRSRFKRALALSASALLAAGGSASAAAFRFSGYAKSLNFLTDSAGGGRARGLTGNRLRMEGGWQDRKEVWDLKLVSDHEVLAGSLVSAESAALRSGLARDELLDLQWDLNQKQNLIWRHALYRASARARWKKWELALGRQRIAWGQARLWNPTDAINPYNPLSVEREERPGSDAAHLRWNASGLSFLEAVYVPRRDADWDKSLLLARARANYGQMDWGLLGGKRQREGLIGFDHAAQVWEGSLRSEGAYVFASAHRRDFVRAVVSFDTNFSFARPVYALLELFHNGIGERNEADYFKVRLQPGDPGFLARNYVGLGSSCELSSLWKLELYSIWNGDDGSAFLGPRIQWQPVADLEISAGAQAFAGPEASEFGRARDLGFFQVQYFF